MVIKCYATGWVTGGDNSAAIGGLCGENNAGSITKCYATGWVTGGYNSWKIGGLCGFNVGYISDSHITNCYATGLVYGYEDVGGLCGNNNENGRINNCYSIGSVAGYKNIGGLCGVNDEIGRINNCYATGSVTGNNYLGGLVGNNGSGIINSSYSTGEVDGVNNVGGLAGSNSSGTITDTFWDVQTSSIGTSGDDNFGATGRNTLEMQDPNTFLNVGWDFDITWWINKNRDYPKLGFQPFGDLNNDSQFDLSDLALMSAAWQTTDGNTNYNSVCELTGDTTIGPADMAILAQMWLHGPHFYTSDINNDYRVDQADLTILAEVWLFEIFIVSGEACDANNNWRV